MRLGSFLVASALSVCALVAPGVADAANPFESAGEFGVGAGWRTFPGNAAGTSVVRDGDKLRLDGTGAESVSACTDKLIPVSGRVLLTGLWKAEGIEVDSDWKGARVRIVYFDAAGERLKGDENKPQVAFTNSGRDWASLDAVLTVPAAAGKARVCGEMLGVSKGSMWLKDVNLTKLQHTDADDGKNVLWILVDTLRADRLGTYGFDKPVSPNLDGLAAQGLLFENSWTQYTWTVPSTISFFTSQYARSHGWASTAAKVADGDYTEMSATVPTLAQVLRQEGFITTGNYANGLLQSGIGVSRGFLQWKHGNDEEVIKRSLADIAQWDADGGQNFLYVHLMTPHIPIRPTGAAQKAAGVSLDVPADGFRYYEGDVVEKMSEAEYNALYQQAYEASVFDADRYVGQLLTALEKHGHADDTIVIVTSDHGELVGEHGLLGHGSYLYEGLTHVPLIVRAPGQKARRVTDRVGRTIDLAPTVLSYLGLESRQPKGWQGLSLFTAKPGMLVASERDYMSAFTADGTRKIIENTASGELLHAFDLQADPGETSSVGAEPAWVQALQQQAAKWRQTTPPPDAAEVQTRKKVEKTEEQAAEDLEMLRALGYIE